MRVGPIGPGWWVRCRSLGTDRDAWEANGDTPVVRVGTADESYSRFYSFLLMDRQSRAAIVEVRAASIVGGLEPTCIAENGRLLIVTDGWVSEVNASTKTVLWEYLADAPVLDAWLLADGRLLVVSETEIVSLDARGEKVWRETIGATVSDFRRLSPLLHIMGDDGSRVVIDEVTGAVSRR